MKSNINHEIINKLVNQITNLQNLVLISNLVDQYGSCRTPRSKAMKANENFLLWCYIPTLRQLIPSFHISS